jgi:hypothetical protein
MPGDESEPTSNENPSGDGWSVENWWEDMTSLSARRKWSPERRMERAESLRRLRQLKYDPSSAIVLRDPPPPVPDGFETWQEYLDAVWRNHEAKGRPILCTKCDTDGDGRDVIYLVGLSWERHPGDPVWRSFCRLERLRAAR